MNCRLEKLAAIQAEMSEFARLVEARGNPCRQTELCRSLLENDQTLPEGQQRLDQVVQRRVSNLRLNSTRNNSDWPQQAGKWSHSTTG